MLRCIRLCRAADTCHLRGTLYCICTPPLTALPAAYYFCLCCVLEAFAAGGSVLPACGSGSRGSTGGSPAYAAALVTVTSKKHHPVRVIATGMHRITAEATHELLWTPKMRFKSPTGARSAGSGVDGGAARRERGLLDGLRERRVAVARARDVLGRRAVLHAQNALLDQVARRRSHDVRAQDLVRVGVSDELDEAIRVVDRLRAAVSLEGELAGLQRAAPSAHLCEEIESGLSEGFRGSATARFRQPHRFLTHHDMASILKEGLAL